jgi:LEA14-like dessication related protein
MKRAFYAAMLSAACMSAGCLQLGGLGGLGEQILPKVSFQRLKITDIDFTEVSTDVVLRIDNPNPIGLTVAEFSYDLDLAGHDLVDGDQPGGLTIAADGSSKLALPVHATFREVFALAGDLRGEDAVPFQLAGEMGFRTPLGLVRVPVRASGSFPVLHLPAVRLRGVRVGALDPRGVSATVTVELGVQHDSGGSLTLGAFDYDLRLGGASVLHGQVTAPPAVTPGAEQTIAVPLTVQLLPLGATVIDALTRRTRLDVDFDATLSVGTPYGPVPLRVDEHGLVDVF